MRKPRILAGRGWAYVGTLLGVSVSALANYGETVTNDAVPALMKIPAAGLMALLPIGLFVALEVLVRNRIKEHLNWWRGGMLITALAFAVPSYSHMHDLLVDWGQNAAICILTPFGFDGLMLLSTLALLLDPDKTSDEGNGRPPSRYDYVVAIPDLPMITRTIVLPNQKPIEIEKAEPISTVTMKPRRPKKTATRKATGVRFNRPEDHPLFAEWSKAEGTPDQWSDEKFAAKAGKSVGAARAQAGRWRAHLASKPSVNGAQMELIET